MNSIEQMIKRDIGLCDDAVVHPEKSHHLYSQLMAKYKQIFPDFGKGMMAHIKTPSSNYVSEIQEIKSQLEVYSLLDLTSIGIKQRNESESKKKESTRIKKGDLLKTAFDSYIIVKLIDQGGNGRVFEVKNEEGESYAAKIVDMENLIGDKRKRLKNEIHFCEMNSHENVIHIFDDGILEKGDKSFIFYIMPLYQTSLRRLMREGMKPEKIVSCFEDICRGLEYAHSKECVHRDIKPENILVNENGRCIIADFGIAHFIKQDQRTMVETKSSSRLANFSYRAPEQMDGSSRYTSATDIFALGLILNEMFTGNIPSGADFKKIGDVNAEYGFLDGLVDKMIAQAPERRHQSIHELMVDYNAIAEEDKNSKKIKRLGEPLEDSEMEFNDIEIKDIKIDGENLVVILSDDVSAEWVNIYRRALNPCITNPFCYRNFRFDGNEAKYRLSDIYDDSIAVNLIDEFKRAVKATNSLYIEKIKEHQKLLYETELRIRQEEIERLSRENALRAKLKKLL